MMNFFDSIVSFFETIFELITNFLANILNFFAMIHTAASIPGVFAPLLPTVLYTSMTVIIGVAILKAIFGR